MILIAPLGLKSDTALQCYSQTNPNEKRLTVDFPSRQWSFAKIRGILPHLASLVRGFPVDVELKVLVLVHEAPSRLEDGKVAGILLGEQVRVVAMRQLRLDLDGLEADLD